MKKKKPRGKELNEALLAIAQQLTELASYADEYKTNVERTFIWRKLAEWQSEVEGQPKPVLIEKAGE